MLRIILVIVLFASCDQYSFDNRIKLIINEKKTFLSSFKINEDGYMVSPNCNDLYESPPRLYFFKDSTRIPTLGSWDKLKNNDTLIVYLIDSVKFINYCQKVIPFDSCYRKYYYSKQYLIQNKWTIVINE